MQSFSPFEFPILFHPSDWGSFLEQGISKIDYNELYAEYQKLKHHAPRRALRGSNYLSPNRNGYLMGHAAPNRFEEHLAIAIWRARTFFYPSGEKIDYLDYQVPLKAKASDTGLGKVDLLAVSGSGRLIVTELKVQKNTPLRALTQGIRYAAILDANIKELSKEIEQKFGVNVKIMTPAVQILAPKYWWNNWIGITGSRRNRVGNWEQEFVKLINIINEDSEIGITIECVAIDDIKPEELDYGPKRSEPKLRRKLSLHFVRPTETPAIIGNAN